MKTLQTIILALALIATLAYTMGSVVPVLAGQSSPPVPNVACEGYVCRENVLSCILLDPTTPNWTCTNYCLIGGRWRCLGDTDCVWYGC
jgi:hypothetical protein